METGYPDGADTASLLVPMVLLPTPVNVDQRNRVTRNGLVWVNTLIAEIRDVMRGDQKACNTKTSAFLQLRLDHLTSMVQSLMKATATESLDERFRSCLSLT